MEDKLRKFAETHRDEFDFEQLPEGHFGRFEAKLPSRRPVRRLAAIGLSAAASVALLLTLVLPNLGRDNYSACATHKEAEEISSYYNMQMNDVIASMEEIYEQDPDDGLAGLLSETRRVQADTRKFEQEVMPGLPCSERGIFAIFQHYSNSLEAMRGMLQTMQHLSGTAI